MVVKRFEDFVVHARSASKSATSHDDVYEGIGCCLCRGIKVLGGQLSVK